MNAKIPANIFFRRDFACPAGGAYKPRLLAYREATRTASMLSAFPVFSF